MGKYDWLAKPGVYAYFVFRGLHLAWDGIQLARACRLLLGLAGLEDETLWTERGPSRRASWIKGYLHRDDERVDSRRRMPLRPLVAVQALSRREKTTLLVAFDLWNGTGGATLSEILGLPPRLAKAVAGLIEASVSESPEDLIQWIARWSRPSATSGN